VLRSRSVNLTLKDFNSYFSNFKTRVDIVGRFFFKSPKCNVYSSELGRRDMNVSSFQTSIPFAIALLALTL